MNTSAVLEVALSALVGIVVISSGVVIWYGPGYWAVRDAYRRGKGSSTIILLWLLFGPLTALIWLVLRPAKTILETSPQEFANPEDALSAAARLDHSGEWTAARRVYESVAERWPEHREYAQRSIEAIQVKEIGG